MTEPPATNPGATPPNLGAEPDRAPNTAGYGIGLVAQLNHTSNALRSYVERAVLLPEGMRWTAWDVLVLICRRRGIETRAVAAEVGIAKATLTEVLAGLVGRGLVRRHRHATDKRRVHLQPTDTGLALVGRLHQRVQAEEARLLGRTEPPVSQQFADMLQALAHRARHLATVQPPGPDSAEQRSAARRRTRVRTRT
ncbi:MarR family winged helix-turn-helix transcriptional regulator [Planosporangium mesophilum]|uniref:HTH marR-type domain-containing protein n=1 Tax=Planosporangium mesophilum TaxID=689768 RepID=A0A8J3WZU3_9ACTN|nr:MarR family winged helix-turn-helix transcriptional regulator [Planosporangium mesophilum]NJC83149.1 winged helix-turn-helix transcriptional regulator [Planosporangium mesophilum]GII22567.1 hypothetical protein Pme01_21640 [Planosporangium mesophilum]